MFSDEWTKNDTMDYYHELRSLANEHPFKNVRICIHSFEQIPTHGVNHNLMNIYILAP